MHPPVSCPYKISAHDGTVKKKKSRRLGAAGERDVREDELGLWVGRFSGLAACKGVLANALTTHVWMPV